MIITKRLILRPMQVTDAEKMYYNWGSNPNVYRYLNHGPFDSPNVIASFISDGINKRDINFLILNKEDNEPIGQISVTEQSADFKTAEVGYVLAEEYWHKGIMSEALIAFIDYLFAKTNFEEIRARHHKYNIASGMVMMNAKMHKMYNEFELSDKFGPVEKIHYHITRSEYLLNKQIDEISNYFGIKIPEFYHLDDLVNYLKKTSLLFEQLQVIDNGNLKDPFVEGVYTIVNKDLNLHTYMFFSKARPALNKKLELFKQYNDEYIVTNTSLKMENIILNMLKRRSLHISFAESCTGGLLASTLINAAGASKIINESYVTYSEEAKVRILGVNQMTIVNHTVYSKEVAIEMVKGLYAKTHAEVCVSITGKAGGELQEAGDGSYDFAVIIKLNGQFYTYHEHKSEQGTRNEVRKSQVNYVFFRLIKLLEYYLAN